MISARQTKAVVELSATGNLTQVLGQIGPQSRRAATEIQTAGRRATNAITAAARSSQRAISGAVGVAGRAMRSLPALAAGVASGGIGLLGRSFIRGADDAERASRRFDAVFGGLRHEARETAYEIAYELNVGLTDIEETFSRFATSFRGFGFLSDEALDASETMARLAGDIAETFGDSLDQVGMALQMGLQGATRGLRNYGIMISEAEVQARLLEQGYESTSLEADNLAAAQVRLNLIVERANQFQGAAAAGAQRWGRQVAELKARVADYSDVVGAELITHLQQTVEEFGGMDRVLELVQIGYSAAAELFKGGVDVLGDLIERTSGYIDSLGGQEAAMERVRGVTDATVGGLKILAEIGKVTFQLLAAGAVTVAFPLINLQSIAALVGGAMAGGLAVGVSLATRGLSFMVGVADETRMGLQLVATQGIALLLDGFDKMLAGAQAVASFFGSDFANDIESTRQRIQGLADGWRESEPEASKTLTSWRESLDDFDGQVGRFQSAAFGVASNALDELAESGEQYVRIIEGLSPDWGAVFSGISEAGKQAADGLETALGVGVRQAAAVVAATASNIGAQAEADAQRLRERAARDEQMAMQAALRQAELFADEYSNLMGMVELSVDEQLAALDQWADSQRNRIGQLGEENKLLDEQVKLLNQIIDRVHAEQQAKISGTEEVGVYAKAWNEAGEAIERNAIKPIAGFITGTMKASDAAKAFALSTLDSLGQLAAQYFVVGSIKTAFGLAGGGIATGGSKGLGPVAMLAGGGIAMGGSAAALPLNFYAGGGVVTSPQLFVAGEGKHDEAIVPMPNGAVPVEFTNAPGTGNMAVTVNYNITSMDGADAQRVIAREAASIARVVEAQLAERQSLRTAVRGAGRR